MTEVVLVTGGAGFIGSHLVDALVLNGKRVRIFDNLEPQVHGELREKGSWPDYRNPDAEYILGDVRDRDAMMAAMTGVDVLFHEAAMIGVDSSSPSGAQHLYQAVGFRTKTTGTTWQKEMS